MIRWLNRVVKYIYLFSQAAAMLCLFSIVALITVDVFSRTFLGRATMIADELSGYLLVAIGFLGFSYTLKQGRHISIEILTSRFSRRRQEQLEVPVYAVCLVLVAWLTYVTWGPAAANLATGQRSITTLGAPLWIPYAMVPLGSAMLTVAFFVELVNKVAALRGGANGQGRQEQTRGAGHPGI